MEPVVERPSAPPATEGALLQLLYVRAQEATLEDRYPQSPLVRAESGGQPGQRAAGPARERDDIDVGTRAEFLTQIPAAAYGKGVAAALGDDVRVLRADRTQDRGQRLRLGLAPVRRPVDEVEAHPIGCAPGQGRIERAVGQLLPADHAHRAQPQEPARGGGGAQMVGVGAAERDDRPAGRRREVRRELAPLVADQVRVDQVVPLEQQPDAVPPEAPVRDLFHRRGDQGP